jgi:hypothetical protein
MNQAPTLKRALQAAMFNTTIAFGITAFGEHDLLSNLVYSQTIGLSIWALIDTSQYKLIRNDTQWWRLLWIFPVSVVLGYLAGTTLAGAVLAHPGFDYWADQPRKAWGFLFLSLAAGGIITYFFLSREQLASTRLSLAHTQALAEAAQRQAAESQLKLLQSQLEPHMLFNTLANLRALISHNPDQAQHMLDHLVAYLRATLNSSRAALHPLQTEFDRLRDYLELMAVRMGPRLHYSLTLPPELAAHPVPTLLLQPLVENAIKHGLEPKVAGGSITVSASLTGDQIALEVHDSGMGLSTSQVNPPGFGLTQVRERLATTYGKQFTLDLIAADAGDTCVRVTFPYQRTSPA